MARLTLMTLAALAIWSCGSSDTPVREDTRTRAQRDSAIGRSGLPGSQGVMNALGTADSARARAARTDSLARP